MSRWQDLFSGRIREMSVLQEAWWRIQSRSPAVVVLLAESGLGKTRLVQEFYRWLSQNQDPEGYWPDLLARDRGNLTINPSFDHGSRQASVLPWLWWGIRWTAPTSRNASEGAACGFLDCYHHLEPHLHRLAHQAQQRSALLKVGLTGLATGLSLLPYFGATGGIKDFIESLEELNVVRKAGAQESEGIGERRRTGQQALLQSILGLLEESQGTEAICAGGLPAVLVLDDAQWIDPESLQLLAEVLRRAHKGHWPLLIVATHWEREWNLDANEVAHQTTGIRLPGLLQQCGFFQSAGLDILRLGPLEALGEVVEAAFPGLTLAQREAFAGKCGGNPGLLWEIIAHYQAHPRCFEGQDQASFLTAKAERELVAKTFSLHNLVAQRFADLGETIREVIGIGSYLGMRFSRELTIEVTRRVWGDRRAGELAGAALKAADQPHAIVQEISLKMSEFRQRLFHEVAQGYLAESEEQMAAVQDQLRVTLREWMRGRQHETMPADEQEAFFRLTIREFRAPLDRGRPFLLEATARLLGLLLWQGRSVAVAGVWVDWQEFFADGNGLGDIPMDAVLAVLKAAEFLGQRDVVISLGEDALRRAQASGLLPPTMVAEISEQVAAVYGEMQKFGLAERLLRDALALRRREIEAEAPATTSRERGDRVVRRMELGRTQWLLGLVLRDQGRDEEAGALMKEAQQRKVEMLDEMHLGHKPPGEQGRFAISEEGIRQLIEMLQFLRDRSGARAPSAVPLAKARHALGLTLEELKRLEEAREQLRLSVAEIRALVTDFGAVPSRMRLLSVILTDLVRIHRGLHEESAALSALDEAKAGYRALLAETGCSRTDARALALLHIGQSNFLLEQKKGGAARAELAAGLAVAERHGPLYFRGDDLASWFKSALRECDGLVDAPPAS